MCPTAEYPFSITDLHTTPLGVERIRRNLNLPESLDVVDFADISFLKILPHLSVKERTGMLPQVM